ncbi:MAG TPA: potassium channel protein [Ilumatobacteraceae bacterium]|nr:potassium channel protein [Ilumatobacteraceae bacterium]
MNDTAIGRLRRAIAMVMAVLVVGTIGYLLFGLSFTDAVYQTVTTVSTVGFRELHEFSTLEQWFTIGIIITGVSTVLYTFTLAVQVVVDGELGQFLGRRFMNREISRLRGHTIVCGWGRVGRAVADDLHGAGHDVVVVDIDANRIAGLPYPTVVGDATLDATLRIAGLERAGALIAALEGDAENLFVTLSARAIVPDLFIVARARQDESVPKLANAGADRVVNPQELGAARMASFVARPHVAEFVDVVMHERSLEFRMQEFEITDGSPLVGKTLRDANLRKTTGVLVLAVRLTDGSFTTNPDPGMVIENKQVLIAVGTDDDLHSLVELTTA